MTIRDENKEYNGLKYLAAELLGRYSRRSSEPSAHVHDGALQMVKTAIARETSIQKLRSADGTGLRYSWNSLELGVLAF